MRASKSVSYVVSCFLRKVFVNNVFSASDQDAGICNQLKDLNIGSFVLEVLFQSILFHCFLKTAAKLPDRIGIYNKSVELFAYLSRGLVTFSE